MKTKKDKAMYDIEYQKTHMTRISLWLNNEKDKEIIDWLNQSDSSKSETIKNVIRNHLLNSKGE